MYVKIVKAPDGEAPQWVRNAWLGLALPVIYSQPMELPGFGVLTGPKSLLGHLWARFFVTKSKVHGFVVDAIVAIDLLEEHDAEAANWWRENAAHMLDGRRYFLFDKAACSLCA